jgi:hypothetical protein
MSPRSLNVFRPWLVCAGCFRALLILGNVVSTVAALAEPWLPPVLALSSAILVSGFWSLIHLRACDGLWPRESMTNTAD